MVEVYVKRNAEIVRMHLDGARNRDIALELGVGKNVVIGTLNRWRAKEGIKAPATPRWAVKQASSTQAVPEMRAEPSPPSRAIRTRRPAPRREIVPPKPAVDRVERERVPFLDVAFGECRFILDDRGDDGLPLCCGRPVFRIHAWCQDHVRRVFVARAA